MKKNFKKLVLSKSTLSNLDKKSILGGADVGEDTLVPDANLLVLSIGQRCSEANTCKRIGKYACCDWNDKHSGFICAGR